MKKQRQQVVVLDNIRSVHNVGSIFRTADALGVAKIYLCGTTPTPTDRFGRERKDLMKVALGAEKSVAWEYVADTLALVKKLKKAGWQIAALEQDATSVDLRKAKVSEKIALVLGNEVGGVDIKILALADTIVEIPMKGKKESLNVSVSFGIAGYELFN